MAQNTDGIDLGALIFSRTGEVTPPFAWDSHLLLQRGDRALVDRPVNIYRDLISGLYETVVTDQQADRFAVDAKRAVIGSVAFAEGSWSGHRRERTRQHVRAGNSEFVRVQYRYRGSAIYLIGDEVIVQNGPVIMLGDQGCEYTTVSTDWSSTQIYLPYDLVGYDPSRHPPLITIPANTPIGRILAVHIRLACAAALTVPADEGQVVVNGAAALFRETLLGIVDDESRSSFQQARANAMQAYLRQNIKKPGLGIDDLLANFGASRSTIFRDFEPVGGISNYIVDQRIKSAAKALIACKPIAGVVSRLSEEYGFSSHHHFTHAFRNRTGLAPRDLLRAKEL